MEVFLSYSRKDQAHAEVLAEGVKRDGHSLWFDEDLSGGAEWWQTILKHIRTSDAFLAIVSRASLASTACTRERAYAVALGKPLLPVLVEPVSAQMLPPDIAQLQMVDFTTRDMSSAFRLAGGFEGLPPRRPLPDPLPTPPDIPLSYLSEISQQVYAESLTKEQQLAIITKLREAICDEDDYDAAMELARLLQDRNDLYAAAERPLLEVLNSGRPRPSAKRTATVTTRRVNVDQPQPKPSKTITLTLTILGCAALGMGLSYILVGAHGIGAIFVASGGAAVLIAFLLYSRARASGRNSDKA